MSSQQPGNGYDDAGSPSLTGGAELERARAELVEARETITMLRDTIAEYNKPAEHPSIEDILTLRAIRHVLERAGVPTEDSGKTLLLPERFHGLMSSLDSQCREFKIFVDMLQKGEDEDAKNYVTAQVTKGGRSYECTLQVANGMTPGEMLTRKDEELTALRAAAKAVVESRYKKTDIVGDGLLDALADALKGKL